MIKTSLALSLAIVALGACGSDDGVTPDGGTDSDTEVTEVIDDSLVSDIDDTTEGDSIADTVGDVAIDAAPETGESPDISFDASEVTIDRNCQYDPRLANARSSDRRCGACRSALGALRVRAELLWSGTYADPEVVDEACTLFPGRACKASVLEAEALLCEDLNGGVSKVVWSDLAIAIVGEGDEAAPFEVRGPGYGIRLGEVWGTSPAALLETAEAFVPGSWKVGAVGEQVAATITENPRQENCPVGRYTIDGRQGTIGSCLAAVALLGKVH